MLVASPSRDLFKGDHSCFIIVVLVLFCWYIFVYLLMNVLESQCSWLCLHEIFTNVNIVVSLFLFVYFVYIYSCSVCWYIFVYLYIIFMLLFVAILSSAIICKQVCLRHCFVVVAFAYNFKMKRCKTKTTQPRFCRFHNNTILCKRLTFVVHCIPEIDFCFHDF